MFFRMGILDFLPVGMRSPRAAPVIGLLGWGPSLDGTGILDLNPITVLIVGVDIVILIAVGVGCRFCVVRFFCSKVCEEGNGGDNSGEPS